MIVPFVKGTTKDQPSQPMPSPTDLLMALAEMQKQSKTQPETKSK